MDMGNLVETVVHHLLIGWMACLGRWDGFPMVSALVYVMHTGQDLWWIMMQGYQLSWFTKLLNYMDSQPWENIESVPKSTGGFDLWWDLKMVIYPYGLGHYWSRLVTTGILNRGTIISHRIEIVRLLGWSKGHVVIIIPLMEFDICSLELEYVNWSHNKWDL